LSEIVVLQWPAQVASVQHVLLLVHSWPAEHAVVPLTPQLIVWLQLFVTLLHWLEPHAICGLSGTQPHAPFVHVAPPAQAMQSIGLPQLSVVIPHRLSHQCGSGEQMHVPSAAHPSPGAQGPVHIHWVPHESDPGLQRFWQNVRSGEQASPGASANPASDASSLGADSSALSCCATSSPPALVSSAPPPSALVSAAGASSPAVTSPPPPFPSPPGPVSPAAASDRGIPSSMPRRLPQPTVPSAAAPAATSHAAKLAEAKRFPRFIP
jgi:hypothetical protein